jgi:hypothetical protein
MSGSVFMEAARLYVSYSWYLLPLQERSKMPAKIYDYEHGVHTAKATWLPWLNHPSFNIGVAAGPSNIVIVDIDPRNGGSTDALVARFGDEVLDTVRQVTGNAGGHLLFDAEGLVIRKQKLAGCAGIDIIAQGGYVLLAPSVHPVTGLEYYWDTDNGAGLGQRGLRKLSSVPRLLDALTAPAKVALVSGGFSVLPPMLQYGKREREQRGWKAYGRKALEGACDDVVRAGAGDRNNTLNKAAWRLGRLSGICQIDVSEIWRELEAAGSRAGLDKVECRATINSGQGSGLSNPLLALPGPALERQIATFNHATQRQNHEQR